MGSMGFMITVSVLLIVGAVVGVVAQRRTQRNRPPSDLDAEAEANHWLVRLGGGLVPPDARAWAGADEAAGRSLTSAAECHRAARAQLAGARTAGEYAEVTRVAREGLEHLRSARTALGIDSDVAVSAPPHAVRVSAVGGACAVTSR
ncbi:hypothetical protein [Streptomyces sp. NBC_01235]|uniref:hypothetical protein n=1 Tax=Streptomyces sp. NBC_01235 TaxID=2903788 RepID=UPI002E164B52|nr:hypothetical protein OG289_26340 [Streptomyces sp. NBC_01235]